MEPVDTIDEMESPAGLYDGMVDNLVTQFSSALDCFRELVQNSIDAGTPQVDVWMEYLPGEGHEGTIAIHIDDYGEGMDEEIIDNQFTQLFASTKDDDLTKIGKFGIGFVSVFALLPRAVLVHTGRSGEYWEVLFHEDRSFSKTRVDNPVEGTQITLFLEGEYFRYQELAEEIPATLRHWCSHSVVEVTFEDRTGNEEFAPPEVINEEFKVDGECLQKVEHQGTEIVLAYSERPIYGFYNRGLTLALTDIGENVLERWQDRFEFIAFKIKSRYLEHTLARDSVVRDEQYEKAMELLEEAANGPLLEALIEEIEELAGAESWSVNQYDRYGHLMRFLANEPMEAIIEHADRPILRCVNGAPLSLNDAWARVCEDGHLLLDHEATPLSEMLGDQDIPVLMGAMRRQAGSFGQFRAISKFLIRGLSRLASGTARGAFWGVVHRFKKFVADDESSSIPRRIQDALMTPQSVYIPLAVDEEMGEQTEALVRDARKLLDEAKVGFGRIATAVVTADEGDAPFFVIAPKLGPLMARPEKSVSQTRRWLSEHGLPVSSPEEVNEKRRQRMEVAVNREHPQFEMIASIYKSDPAMGAYFLARGLLLSKDHMLETDSSLLKASLPDAASRFHVAKDS